jgi:hypothetical protein
MVGLPGARNVIKQVLENIWHIKAHLVFRQILKD